MCAYVHERHEVSLHHLRELRLELATKGANGARLCIVRMPEANLEGLKHPNQLACRACSVVELEHVANARA